MFTLQINNYKQFEVIFVAFGKQALLLDLLYVWIKNIENA